MNVELLEKVKKHILEEPRRFYMPWFIIKKERGDTGGDSRRFRYAQCVTAGCIAGWTCLLVKGMKYEDRTEGYDSTYDVAKKLLELSDIEAKRLFAMYTAPEQFNEMYSGNGTKKAAVAAGARIDHFIATEGRD